MNETNDTVLNTLLFTDETFSSNSEDDLQKAQHYKTVCKGNTSTQIESNDI